MALPRKALGVLLGVTLIGLAAAAVFPPSCKGAQLKQAIDETCLPPRFGVPAPNNTYCYPCDKAKYILCAGGKATLKGCPKGQNYDYTTRKCQPYHMAQVCKGWLCPSPGNYTAGTNGVSEFFGEFGKPGTWLHNLTKPGQFDVFCPVMGHCTTGMLFNVKVLDASKRPKSRPLGTVVIRHMGETMSNTDHYPEHISGVEAYVGDVLRVDWSEPIHVIAMYDQKAQDASPVIATPPQPVWKCPVWAIATEADIVNPPKVPGETILELNQLAGEHTWTARRPDTVWFACTLPAHCRMGMIFRTVVLPNTGSKPKTYSIRWEMDSYDNFPDLNLYVGDQIKFTWNSPQIMLPDGTSFFDIALIQYHGLSQLKNVSSYGSAA